MSREKRGIKFVIGPGGLKNTIFVPQSDSGVRDNRAEILAGTYEQMAEDLARKGKIDEGLKFLENAERIRREGK